MSVHGNVNTLLQRFQSNVSQLLRHRETRGVAVALSGGADSVALSWLWHESHVSKSSPAAFRQLPLNAIIVDHKLRPESTQEAQDTARRFQALTGRRPWIVDLDWETRGGIPPSSKMETEARKLRYQALARMCYLNDIDLLMTGHHADDQAETVLIRLMNGSKDVGLSGMAPVSQVPECERVYGVNSVGNSFAHTFDLKRIHHQSPLVGPNIQLLRPLLPFQKSELYQLCREQNLEWSEDQTNKVSTLTKRNAVRHVLNSGDLPRAFQTPRLLQLADSARAANDAEYSWVKRLHAQTPDKGFNAETGVLGMTIPFLTSIPQEVMATYLRDIINAVARRSNVSRNDCMGLLKGMIDLHDDVTRHRYTKTWDELEGLITTAGRKLPTVGDVRVKGIPRPDKKHAESGIPMSWTFYTTPPSNSSGLRTMHLKPFKLPDHTSLLVNPDYPNPTLWDGRFWIKVSVQIPRSQTPSGIAFPQDLKITAFNESDHGYLSKMNKNATPRRGSEVKIGNLDFKLKHWKRTLRQKWVLRDFVPPVPVLRGPWFLDRRHVDKCNVPSDGEQENILAIPLLDYIRPELAQNVSFELAHKSLGYAGINASVIVV